MKTALKFQIIESTTEIDQIVATIFAAAVDAPVFYSPGMLRVWREFTAEKMVLAVLISDKKPIIALPLFRQEQWQNVALDGWDNLDALRDQNCANTQETFFWLQLAEHFGGVKLTEFTEKSRVLHSKKGVNLSSISRRKCPYVLLESTWEKQNEKLSKKLVRNLRQYGNKASAAGITFSVRMANELTLEEQKEKLDIAFSFHEKRMEEINQHSKFSPAQWAEYHLSVLQKVQNAFVIEAQNEQKETIAFYYGLLNKSRLSWFNGGYSPAYLKMSIGTLLVSKLISYAMEQGISVFDFLRGNETYKQKWTSHFDLNQDIYLNKDTLLQNLKWKTILFNDTRKRIGSKRAFQKLVAVSKS